MVLSYLQDVQFVNCRFELSVPSIPAKKFLDYAVVGKGSLGTRLNVHRGLFVPFPPRPAIKSEPSVPGRSLVCGLRGIGGTSAGSNDASTGPKGWRRRPELVDTARIRRKAMTPEKQQLDWNKIKQFWMQVSNDIGAAMLGALTYIGDRLGIFTLCSSDLVTAPGATHPEK